MADKVKLEKNKKNKTEIIFIYYLFTFFNKNIFEFFKSIKNQPLRFFRLYFRVFGREVNAYGSGPYQRKLARVRTP